MLTICEPQICAFLFRLDKDNNILINLKLSFLSLTFPLFD